MRFRYCLLIALLSAANITLAENPYYFTHAGSYVTGACGGTTTKYFSSEEACAATGPCAGPNAPIHSGVAGWDTGGDAAGTCVGSQVSCKNKNGTQMGSTLSSKKICCPSGQTFDGIRCHVQCTAPQVWSPSANACVTSCPAGTSFSEEHNTCVPDCEEDETLDPETMLCIPDCDGGTIYMDEVDECVPDCPDPSHITIGETDSGNLYNCAEDIDNGDCSNILGYITGADGVEYQVCADDQEECEAGGGTYGFVNDQQVCLDPDYGDDIPTCDSQGVVILTEDGFLCESPQPPDDEEAEKPDCPDNDHDGICNKNDGDIDGDGTTNDTDTDDDGDGIPDTSDPTSKGEQEAPSEAGGGGDCKSSPTCKGDAIACASLKQIWMLRCQKETAKLTGEGNCSVQPTCEGPKDQCAIQLMNWRDECSRLAGTAALADLNTYKGENGFSRIDKGTNDLTEIASGVFSTGGTTGSCPAPESVTVLGQTFEFSYETACDAAEQVRPFVLAAAGLIAAAILHRAF